MSNSETKFSVGQLSGYLDQPIDELRLIKENKYCYIFKAVSDKQPFIIKQYKGEDPSLVTTEAEALDFYHTIAEKDSDLIDSRAIKLIKEKNLLSIGYVEGEPFSELLYRSRRNPELQQQAVRNMRILGRFLNRLYSLTVSEDSVPSPFLFEYSDYCAEKLRRLLLFGGTTFRHIIDETHELSEQFRNADVPTSFIHGDFVFLNIHISGDRVGLIDLANTNRHSHLLNDLYNLLLALDNMVIPNKLKQRLREALKDGLGDLQFPTIAHHFYYEYHRRRWLMLKLGSFNPKDLLQGMRGLFGFAVPFKPERMF